MRRKNSPVTLFITGLILACIGGAIFYMKAWPDYKDAKASSSWTKILGTVEKSRVTEKREVRKKKSRTIYSAEIVYSYIVDDILYKSSEITVGGSYSSSSSSEAYSVKNKYPKGSKVIVYYPPNKPSKAILEPGIRTATYIFLGSSILSAVIGFIMLIKSLIKLLLFTAKAGFLVTGLVSKKKSSKSIERTKKPRRGNVQKPIRVKRGQDKHNELEIDLDNEMAEFNKISATSMTVSDTPWDSNWFLKGKDRDFGPYSFEKIVALYKKNKIKDRHQCYSQADKKVIFVSEIVNKR